MSDIVKNISYLQGCIALERKAIDTMQGTVLEIYTRHYCFLILKSKDQRNLSSSTNFINVAKVNKIDFTF